MLGIFYSSLPSSLSCRIFTFISGFGRKISGFKFGGHFALGYICLFLKLTLSPCCPSERLSFCFSQKLLLFPGQRHVPDPRLWVSHSQTWGLRASQLSPSLQLCTQPSLCVLADVWLLGFNETLWVTYACFPEALLGYLLVC